MASLELLESTIYFESMKEIAIQLCFFDFHIIRLESNKKIYLIINFFSSKYDTWFALVYSTKVLFLSWIYYTRD